MTVESPIKSLHSATLNDLISHLKRAMVSKGLDIVQELQHTGSILKQSYSLLATTYINMIGASHALFTLH